jgi:hypothetical protein
LFNGIGNYMMLTISNGETQRPLKLREGVDRRVQADRRRSPVGMRLRVGLWYQYHRATRAGEFDPLPRDAYKRTKLQEALLPEMQKYEFLHRESNSSVSASCALSSAVDFLWAHPELGCNAAGESTAAYALSEIAEYLGRAFKVRPIDRRKNDRRMAESASA